MGASVAAGNVLYTDDADTFLTYMKELRGGFDEACLVQCLGISLCENVVK